MTPSDEIEVFVQCAVCETPLTVAVGEVRTNNKAVLLISVKPCEKCAGKPQRADDPR